MKVTSAFTIKYLYVNDRNMQILRTQQDFIVPPVQHFFKGKTPWDTLGL